MISMGFFEFNHFQALLKLTRGYLTVGKGNLRDNLFSFVFFIWVDFIFMSNLFPELILRF